MILRTGDMFSSTAGYIAHGANTKGVMGAGVAKTIRARFPRNYDVYVNTCRQDRAVAGNFLAVADTDAVTRRGVVVVNLFSQHSPGKDAKLEHIFASTLQFAQKASRDESVRIHGGRVAIPRIGCGIGGLDWPDVRIVLRAVEKICPKIDFEVWTL